jgi:hypothetical protein
MSKVTLIEDSMSVEQYARSKAHEAIDVLAEVMTDDGAKGSERVAAASALLDRGHGKPTQAVITVPARTAARAALAAMSTTELLARIGEERLKSRGVYTGRSPLEARRDRLETAQHSTSVNDSRSAESFSDDEPSSYISSPPAISDKQFIDSPIRDMQFRKATPRHFKEGPPAIKWEFDIEPEPINVVDPLCL